jgi:Tfp pilus assembly protein PilV
VTSVLPTDDSGFALIEVLVSAMLVAVIAVGVMAGLDTASLTSGQERARSQAAAVAQGDQERLRALSSTALNAMVGTPQTTNKTLDGQAYTITSTVTRVSEAGAGSTCAGATSSVSYLQIKSAVTWAGRPSGIQPHRANSITPIARQGGTLVVRILDRNRAPVSGVQVTVSPGTSVTTTATGCAQWDGLAAGDYTVSISKLNHVTPDGNTSKVVTVSADTTKEVSFDFDQGAGTTIGFWGRVGAWNWNFTSATAPQGMDQLSLEHSALTSPMRIPTPAAGFQPSLATGTLYPHTSAYTVYPGACSLMNGGALSPSRGAYTLTVTSASATLTTPVEAKLAGVDPYPGKIRLPTYKMWVNYRWGPGPRNRDVDGARVFLYRAADAAGCPAKAMPPQTTANGGFPQFPAVPFGTYHMCIEYADNGTNGAILNTSDPGVYRLGPTANRFTLSSYTEAVLDEERIDTNNGSNAGSCPATYP